MEAILVSEQEAEVIRTLHRNETSLDEHIQRSEEYILWLENVLDQAIETMQTIRQEAGGLTRAVDAVLMNGPVTLADMKKATRPGKE